jgi:hypothetical protein
MDSGYYLALAGGVLNTGHSENDLDLVAVPRTLSATPEKLLGVFSDILDDHSDEVRSATVHYGTVGQSALNLSLSIRF